ncbi:mucin-like protein isoform X5 [Dreissena polymorpha]|uniref:mucin-like protein isoform X5 n=2 Tax=Dreissena polymorpha TaxID=45954 RepID=UPI002264ADD0|nr:mucin-like protein isoform X5 [Dreissena polymorpha]
MVKEENMAKTFGLFLMCVCLLTVLMTINKVTAQQFGSTTNLCEKILTDKNLISLFAETKDAANPCACAEYDMAQDAMFEKVGICYEELLFNDCVKQRCCYSENGKLLTGYRDNRFSISDGIQHSMNEIHDSCCNINNQSRCNAFYEITQSNNCQRHQDQHAAYSWGDPVIETVSTTSYSFNGHGEYVFLKSNNTLEIQARTDYLIANSTDSTIFTAFVFTIYPQKPSIHVIFNRTSMNLNLYDSKGIFKTSTSSVCNPRQPLMTGAFFVLCSNTASALGFQIAPQVKLSNIKALVTLDNEFMNIKITYSKELANMTGLAGNVQGGFYVSPNGAKYSVNSSESLMFEYGETWSLRNNINSSNFWYNLTGGDFSFFNKKSTPRFLENLLDDPDELFKNCNNSMISAFKNTCKHSWDNQTSNECMLTIARTCNTTLGKAIQEQVERQRYELQRKSNKPPTFMASMPNETTLIYKGYSSWTQNLLDHVQDENRAGLRFEVKPNITEMEIVGGVLNWTVGTALRYMNLSDNSIQFIVYDQFNMSESHSVRIRYCGCEDPSECEFQNEDDDNAECRCRNRFVEGLFCEIKIDPCSKYVCYKNDTCNTTYSGDGSPCAVCPLGFYEETHGPNQLCRDLNECNDARTHNCDQECINDLGSYHCACNNGYQLKGNFTCSDVDECVLGNYSCPNPHEECVNLPGTYTCGCASGYSKFNTTSFCVKLDGLHFLSNMPVAPAVGSLVGSEQSTEQLSECYNKRPVKKQKTFSTKSEELQYWQIQYFKGEVEKQEREKQLFDIKIRMVLADEKRRDQKVVDDFINGAYFED